MATDSPGNELGDFLRSRRQKLLPRDVGLPGGRRRRTPGLRREEVAELADIGIDWYVRLEQGRNVHPSPATVDALARALRLTKAEHTHLRALARPRERRTLSRRETVPDAIRRLVERLPLPAYVTGRRWDVLAWNAAAVGVLGDFGRLAPADRNLLAIMFVQPEARQVFGPAWVDEAQRMVAQFRAAYDLWSYDPGFADLVGRLRAASADFARWWQAHEVRRVGTTGQKQLHHPAHGQRRFEYATFQSNDDPALKLVIYTPL